MTDPIYFDFQATTPTDPRVLDAMLPYFGSKFGNPHSTSHSRGIEAAEAVEKARAQIAKAINADSREIIFTSGATEANNLAIQGTAAFWKDNKPRVLMASTEHKCVLESCNATQTQGFDAQILPVDKDGLIDLGYLETALSDQTALVSVMAANNETGVLQPLKEIADLCGKYGAYLHSDAAQALGKIPLDVQELNVNLMSFSGHKIYGPMGIGALYVRRRPRTRLEPLFYGGGQERTLRSGTVPLPLVVGFGEAAAISVEEMDQEQARFKAWQTNFVDALKSKAHWIKVNGSLEKRLTNNLNLTFSGYRSDELFALLADFQLSSGSACTSASVEPSYVLKAMGLSAGEAAGSLRISFGRTTTNAEVKALLAAILALAPK
jgi:cysteine desulfurase